LLSIGNAVLNTEDYESIPEDEWIASDMTMYDSPLADLERQHCYSGDAIIPVSERVSTPPETPTSGSSVNPSA